MNRQAFLAATGALSLAGRVPAFAAGNDSDGKYGSVINPSLFSGVQSFLSPSVLNGSFLQVTDPIPAGTKRVILDNLPPVMAQGIGDRLGWPGTCESCSYGYGLGGYTAGRALHGPRPGWNAADAHNQPSAAWLYQWVQAFTNDGGACPEGSECVPYFQHLVREGAPSTAQVPYNPNDVKTVKKECGYITALDTTEKFSGAERFIIGSYKGLTIHGQRQAQYVTLFTEMLRNRHAIAFSGLVPNDYFEPKLDSDGVYRVRAGFIKKSGHGQMIVGYDDTLRAFLVQNSMSTQWNAGDANDIGRNGRIWYSYDSFFAGQEVAGLMFPRPPDAMTGIRLATRSDGAPAVTVVDAIARSNSGKSYLLLVLHGEKPINVRYFATKDPSGNPFGTRINELMRIGYRYIEAPAGTFVPGQNYDITLEVGRKLRYFGRITATA